MITVEHLDFYYGNKQVLHDIDLELPQGSVTGLVGANGAGKSTLMRCMAGLERPHTGQVRWQGTPIFQQLRHYFRHVGYLPDLFGLPQGLTVLQCLSYAAWARGIEKSALGAAIERTLALVHLEEQWKTEVHKLSRGQKQRVGIGQIIIGSPEFLLLDEPASGLDPEARHHLSLLIKTLQQEGMTLVVSSHILSELDEYCTHMLAIDHGRILLHQDLHEEQTQQWVVLEVTQSALAQIEQLSSVQMAKLHPKGVVVKIDQGAGARAQFIQQLMQTGLVVSAVYEEKTSLLSSYQSSLRG